MPAWAPVAVRLQRNAEWDGDCWIWQGEKRTGGYGYIEVGGKALRVHRVAYETFVGPIPDGLVVMHSCDRRDCIRQSHLSVGTHKDNNDDMRGKGRASAPPLQTGHGAMGPQKTHCSHGHLLPPYEPVVRRRCRTCNNEQQNARRCTRHELAVALKERDEWKREAYRLADVLPDGKP